MKRAALIVGVNRYEDESLTDLEFAENDAIEVWSFLKYQARYDDARKLLSVDDDCILDTAAEMVKGLAPGDLFLFYFAGHGMAHAGRHLLLCPKVRARRLLARDAYLSTNHTVPVDLLKDELERQGVALVFVLDACRRNLRRAREGVADGLSGERGLRDIVAGARDPAGSSVAIVCSCAEGRQAQELRPVQHGLFSRAWLELMETARQTGAEVRVNETLVDSLQARMTALAERHGLEREQQPWIARSGDLPALLEGEAAEPEPPPPPKPTAKTRPSGERVKCPVCGRRNRLDDTFECRQCHRDFLCERHFIDAWECCQECAPKLAAAQEQGRPAEPERREIVRPDEEAEVRRLAEDETDAKRRAEVRETQRQEKPSLAAEASRFAQERTAAERLEQARQASEQEAQRKAAAEAEQQEQLRRVLEAEAKRLAAEREVQRLQELRQAAEAEAKRLAAENVEAQRRERERLAAEQESQRRRAEEAEAERRRQESRVAEAEAKRQAAEQEAKRQEQLRLTAEAAAERLAEEKVEAEQRERIRQVAEAEAKRQEQLRLAAEAKATREAEERAAADRKELARLAAEKEQERRRAEQAEAERREQLRLIAEAEAKRLAAEQEAQRQERLRQAAEVEARRLAEAEQERHAELRQAAETNAKRLAAETAEAQRRERARLAEEREAQWRRAEEAETERREQERRVAEAEAKRVAAEREAKRQEELRLAAEAAAKRLAEEKVEAEERERIRQTAEAEAKRQEQLRLAAEAEVRREAEERAAADRKELARLAAEKEQERRRAEQAEAERREQLRLIAEAEARRLAAEQEAQRQERLRQAAEAEARRLAEEQAAAALRERQRLAEEEAARREAEERAEADRQARLQRVAEAEANRQTAEAEVRRQAELRAAAEQEAKRLAETSRDLEPRESPTPTAAPEPFLWANSLGMQFTSVPETAVLFCLWPTRVQDYQEFVRDTGWEWERPPFDQGPSHPAVRVNWEDAQAFCRWLTEREWRAGALPGHYYYRLPTDVEWSAAVRLPPESGDTPKERNGSFPTLFPWGDGWPPPRDFGNYGQGLQADPFVNTSPVGSFPPNPYGLYDLSGNVWEWCEDYWDADQRYRVLRGASWINVRPFYLASSYRCCSLDYRFDFYGFRCVLANRT